MRDLSIDPPFRQAPQSGDPELVVLVRATLLTPDEAAVGSSMPAVQLKLGPSKWVVLMILVGVGAGAKLAGFDLIWLYAGTLACAVLAIAWVVVGRIVLAVASRSPATTRFETQAVDWRLDETEVRRTGPFLDMAVPWTGFAHVLDEPARYLFVLSPGHALPLPKRLLSSDQVAGVRELIDRARDRGLIGIASPDLMPDWADIRAAVHERTADN